MRRYKRWLAASLAISLAGCTVSEEYGGAQAAQGAWLGDVHDGTTSIRDIKAKLGQPTETYDNGRVLVYRLVHSRDLEFPPRVRTSREFFQDAPPQVMHGNNTLDDRDLADRNEWDFVAAFDERGILARHNMVAILTVWGLRYNDNNKGQHPSQATIQR
ncbi:MAG TPA: hypothetical protein VFE47_23795 [Tepidisphaeraceae bacterium]|jgi:hypothetical protein|nr:hypothetical protein [Tepidisphaeraceae bacterium]